MREKGKKMRFASVIRAAVIMSILLSFGSSAMATSIPITLKVERAPKDNRGTDVQLVRNITVDSNDRQVTKTNRYDIALYVDDVWIGDAGAETLPFSFQYNFK